MDYDGLSSHQMPESRLASMDLIKPQARFVILWHAVPPQPARSPNDLAETLNPNALSNRSSHFDLMLEKDGRLITFELQLLPIAGEKIAVRPLPSHRVDYLDYEGPVLQGRGHVTQWTKGNYVTASESLEKWIVELYSPRLTARVVLIRPAESEFEPSPLWHLRASRWVVVNHKVVAEKD